MWPWSTHRWIYERSKQVRCRLVLGNDQCFVINEILNPCSSRPYGSSKMCPNLKKSCLRSKYLERRDRLLFQRNWSCRNRVFKESLSDQVWIVHHLFMKRTIRRRRIILHHDNVTSHYPKQFNIWAVKISMHPMISFYFRTWRTNCIVYDFHHL